MKVLIFGATGFVGFPVAQTLVRRGHQVLGQSRSASTSQLFAKEEIEPVIVDPTQDDSWTNLVPTLDAIIDAAGGDNIRHQSMAKVKKAQEAAKSRPPSADKLTYIWTSGTWIQGSHAFESRSDGSAITQAPSLTAWRPEVEKELTSSTTLRGLVIRPSLLYGRSGSITSMFFQQAVEQGSVTWPGDATNRIATIHADDLAQCFLLAVEKAPAVAGLVLDCTNQGQESLHLILTNLAVLAGFSADKITYKKPSNAFEEAVIVSRPLRPSFARSLLGWQPVKPTLTDGLKQYYHSYLAHASQ